MNQHATTPRDFRADNLGKETGSGNTSIAYVGFTTSTQGVAVEASLTSATGLLLMTRDGGHTWAAVTV